MSKRGATHKGPRFRKYPPPPRNMRGQRNRKYDDVDTGLVDFPAEKLAKMVENCRRKASHKTYAHALAAKRESERTYGKEFHIFECPLCGKFHLTTHPWKKE